MCRERSIFSKLREEFIFSCQADVCIELKLDLSRFKSTLVIEGISSNN